MTVAITDNLVEIDAVDASNEAGWTPTSSADYVGFQRAGARCYGDQGSEGVFNQFFTDSASADYTGRTIFGWMRSGNPNTEANDGFGIILGDVDETVASISLNAAGSSYVALDLLTVVGGTGTAATITVDTVGGSGEILTFSLTTGGSYTVRPSTPNSPSGGGGSGASFNLDTYSDGSVSIRTSYTVGGGDNFGNFALGWSGFRLDLASLPTNFLDIVGTAPPNLTRIIDIGYAIDYQTKALGNADNIFWDRLTYIANGSPALRIAGGLTGARGTFAEIVTDDLSTTNAYGIIRELVGAKAYEVFFGLEIGNDTGTDAFFDDSDFQLFLNGNGSGDGGMSAGNMDIEFLGGTATNNVINFANFFVQSLGTPSNWDMSDTDITSLIWSDAQFVDMGTFIFQAQDSGNKTLTNLAWNNCGQVTLVGIDATDLTFNGSTNSLGAIFWDANSVEENQDGLTFVSDGTGHAIEVSLNTASLTTFNIDGYAFSGYETTSDGSTGNTVFIVDNLLDGDVTINVSGGSGTVSYERAAGYTGTVTINANVTTTLTGLQNNSEVTVYDAGDGSEIAHVEDVVGNTFAFSDAAANVVDIFIHHISYYRADILGFTIPSVAASIPVQQTSDPNYVNN